MHTVDRNVDNYILQVCLSDSFLKYLSETESELMKLSLVDFKYIKARRTKGKFT